MKYAAYALFVVFLSIIWFLVPQPAQAFTPISGYISPDSIWHTGEVYVVYGNATVAPDDILTIEPGAIVKFYANSSLTAYGEINANGTSDNKIYFTSFKDDTVGGDTNGDGFSSGALGDWSQINVTWGGTLNLNYSVVRYGSTYGQYTNVFQEEGILNISNSTLEYSSTGLKIIGGSAMIENVLARDNSSAGISVEGGSATIKDSLIQNNDYGIVACNSFTTVENSTINNNNYGVFACGNAISISQNSISDNTTYGLYASGFSRINAENNWWGDASGPYNLFTNPNGQGDKVSTWIDFDPWLLSPPSFSLDPIPSKEPVIIVPGILGSRLNRVSDGDEVWPNSTNLLTSDDDQFLDQLKLDDLGNEILDIDSTSILEREFLIFPFYENLIDKFQDLGYIEGNDLIIFDYDWRQDISSLALELKNVVDSKSRISPTGKVSIVAHSMGGLVAKEFLRQNTANLSDINNVVIAGAPQLGAVKAFNLLNFGDNLNIPILNPNTAKEISQNMPAVYQLLPSQDYINQGGGYVEDHRNGQNQTLNYDETNRYMVDDSRNELLLNLAAQFHQNLDSLNIDGPKITNLVACNAKTLVGVKIFDNKKVDIRLTRGDGTVPFISARQVFSNTNQTNYYAVRDFDHFDLVSKDQALDLISAAAIGDAIPVLSDIKSDDSFCYSDVKKFFLFSTHSPVNLRVYDEQGNYVGLHEEGDVNIGIPGGDFIQIGENNFVLVPEGQNYRAVVDAYNTGSFDFKVRILSSDDSEDSAVYLNIPINQASLNAEFFFDGGFNDISLGVDEDGNGSVDDLLSPNFVIFRTSEVTIENIITNVEGAYRLSWMGSEAREYLIKRLEHANKLEEKSEPKDDEIREILASLLIKLDHYLSGGLINNQAYDIIKEDINSYLNLN